MAETPILRLPIPDGGIVADGPDAFSDLALAVEASMPTYRGVIAALESDADIPVRSGETRTIHTAKVSSTVNGWIEVEYDVGLAATAADAGQGGAQKFNYAGQVLSTIGGSRVRAQRYHSRAQTQYVMMTGRARRAVTGRTITDVEIAVAVDATGDAVTVVNLNVHVVQFGSPVTT